MYKIETFIPAESFDKIRNVLLELDAGHISNYRGCLTCYPVIGIWYSDVGSNPTIGEVGKWSKESELKIEFNVQDEIKDKVVQQLRLSHPYEEPVINVIKLEG